MERTYVNSITLFFQLYDISMKHLFIFIIKMEIFVLTNPQ